MDLSSQSNIKIFFNIDENTQLTTVTFKDPMDVTLGEVTIETVRFRPFFDGIINAARELSPSHDNTVQKYRSRLDINTLEGEINF